MLDSHYFEAKVRPIKFQLEEFVKSDKKIFTTSSFQTQSLPLLHIISGVSGCKTVYMTDTGYLFPETQSFARSISSMLNLDLRIVASTVPKFSQTDIHGRLLYTSDPDLCCELNKVTPLEPVLASHDIWINGVRRDQTDARSRLDQFEEAQLGCTRYHPMLDWTAREIFYYRKCFALPEHPLEVEGYGSIGCQPCTVKFEGNGNTRNARWFGMNKTECGLNTNLIAKSGSGR